MSGTQRVTPENSFQFVSEAVEVLLQTLNIPVTHTVQLINTLAPSVTSCPMVPVLLPVLLVESYQHNKILEHEPFHKALLNAISEPYRGQNVA